MYKASIFRDRKNLKDVSNKNPGYYKWWADRETFLYLISILDVNFNEIEPYVETKDNKYCIYVGIAVKESIRSRIDWHVNQKHRESAVKSGLLSTLRKTVSSIVARNQYDEEATNNFIDKLWIEYFELDYDIKSIEASDTIHSIEREAMLEHLYILNIQENNHPLAQPIKTKLKRLRKESK